MTYSYKAVKTGAKALVQNVTNNNSFCILKHQSRSAYALSWGAGYLYSPQLPRRLILGNPQRLHTVKEVFLFGLKLLVRYASRLLKFGQFLDLLRDVVGL